MVVCAESSSSYCSACLTWMSSANYPSCPAADSKSRTRSSTGSSGRWTLASTPPTVPDSVVWLSTRLFFISGFFPSRSRWCSFRGNEAESPHRYYAHRFVVLASITPGLSVGSTVRADLNPAFFKCLYFTAWGACSVCAGSTIWSRRLLRLEMATSSNTLPGTKSDWNLCLVQDWIPQNIYARLFAIALELCLNAIFARLSTKVALFCSLLPYPPDRAELLLDSFKIVAWRLVLSLVSCKYHLRIVAFWGDGLDFF